MCIAVSCVEARKPYVASISKALVSRFIVL